MNKQDLLMGFQRCRQEIEHLREQNKVLGIENRAYNRVLSVIEAHRPREQYTGEGEDLVWRIKDTEKKLAEEITAENIAKMQAGEGVTRDN